MSSRFQEDEVRFDDVGEDDGQPTLLSCSLFSCGRPARVSSWRPAPCPQMTQRNIWCSAPGDICLGRCVDDIGVHIAGEPHKLLEEEEGIHFDKPRTELRCKVDHDALYCLENTASHRRTFSVEVARPVKEATSELLKLQLLDGLGLMGFFERVPAENSQDSSFSFGIRNSLAQFAVTNFDKVSTSFWLTVTHALMQVVQSPRKFILRSLLLLLFVLLILIVAVVLLGNHMGDTFMTFQDLPIRGNPGYLVDFFGGKCLHLKQFYRSWLHDLETFNAKHAWQKLEFAARDGRPVSAIYFRAEMGSPIVILAHGIAGNYLDSSVQAAAYYLRKLNISSVIPNLRHHGGRGAAAYDAGRALRRWKDQHLDILGAWDYALSDPEGKLGGSRLPSSVGLFGFDFGALAAQIAFAREPRILSMMLDSAVFDVHEMLKDLVKSKVVDPLNSLVEQQAWSRCEARADRDLDTDDAFAKDLVSRTAVGSVAIIQAKKDSFVPSRQSDMLVETLSKNTAGAIKVSHEWRPRADHCSSHDGRPEIILNKPKEYMKFTCSFWWSIFPKSVSHLGCESLA